MGDNSGFIETFTYEELKEWVRLFKESLSEKELRFRNADNQVEFKEFIFSRMKEGDKVVIDSYENTYDINPKEQ